MTQATLVKFEYETVEPVAAPAPAHRPPPGAFYVPQLDALRFFAFFAVFLHHSLRIMPGPGAHAGRMHPLLLMVQESGAFGLSLFFVLSSYLITTLLQAEKRKTGTIALGSFFARRMLRIWPLYFLYLGGVALTGLFVPLFHLETFRLLAMTLLAANWYSILHGMGTPIASHLWSISIEEQFYALWPLLFRVLARPAFLLLSAAIAVFSLAVTGVAAAHHVSSLALWLNSGSEFVFFAVGALFALWHKPIRNHSVRAAFALFAGGVALWFMAEIVGQVSRRPAHMDPFRATCGYALVAIACAVLLSAALRFPPARVPGWLAYLGKISYGLYVFHAVALNLVPLALGTELKHLPGSSMLAIFLSSLAMAAFSYRFIEKPFLRLKSRFEVVRTR
ncbi:acyltransferase [Acidipila sp. EB88]|uniref:acyltransferase family protein n=1 Tax=Acidipila sp. EB88 TaxID=2305226 RepID=UPI0013152AE1|nr:acyltransferase [Acidipila sp. EB88]